MVNPMSSATIEIPEDLQSSLDELTRERNITAAEVIEAALRKYLLELQQRRKTRNDDEFVPYWLPVLPEKDDLSEPDLRINHDYYIAESLERILKRT